MRDRESAERIKEHERKEGEEKKKVCTSLPLD